MPSPLKKLLLGNPLHNRDAAHQRLSNPVALAVFSSDALSSVAYATEEILLALVLAGTAALGLALPISGGIALLLVIVAFSYRQTIKAYPSGGGAYIVAKENLGNFPGLVAGGALLIDYVLTVAVSISAGTAAITSAFPAALPFKVWIAVGLVLVLSIMNLRGVKESGAIFAAPTFFFIAMLALTIVVGLFKHFTGAPIPITPHEYPFEAGMTAAGMSLFLLMKAFASGCTAMTGVEAIANGVQAFKEPASVNARKTLTWMAGILLFMFLGTSALATVTGVRPYVEVVAGQHVTIETIVSQLARGIYGDGSFLYYALQAGTALILILAANTSYADFPRLGSFIAGDGYLPKQLKDRGSRLVYSNGLNLLTAMSILLLIMFAGETSRLIPLYAIGVFTSFTLSQAGMVVHWWKTREPGWQWSAAVNGLGAVTTFVVLLVIAVAKFAAGAWIVLVLVPVLVGYFEWVKHSYNKAAKRVALPEEEELEFSYRSHNRMHNHVVVLFSAIDRRLVRAMQYARSLKADVVEAVYVDVTGDKADGIKAEWERLEFGIKLTIIESPYREIIEPIRSYVCSIKRPTHDHVVTVILPEYVPETAPEYMLHDQTSFWIKSELFQLPGVIISDVPYHPEEYLTDTPPGCAQK
ncbi:MAG: APC family permease [Coriobacteriia bacterium]|nr:APC family permease [Coriobacteriia bacterium]